MYFATDKAFLVCRCSIECSGACQTYNLQAPSLEHFRLNVLEAGFPAKISQRLFQTHLIHTKDTEASESSAAEISWNPGRAPLNRPAFPIHESFAPRVTEARQGLSGRSGGGILHR